MEHILRELIEKGRPLPSTYNQWAQHAPAEAVQLNEAYAYYANDSA